MKGLRIAWHRRKARKLELQAETLLARSESAVKDAVARYKLDNNYYDEDENELHLKKSEARIEARQMALQAEHYQVAAADHYAIAERLAATLS